MAPIRVIQDSDEEDDPQSCEAEPPPAPLSLQQNYPPESEDNHQTNPAVNGTTDASDASHVQDTTVPAQQDHEEINVNFDDFLQSQHLQNDITKLTASQQRKGERWIPSGGGISRGLGSIGPVMAEIGLAQRRLFDDEYDAQYAYGYGDQGVPPTVSYLEYPRVPTYFDQQGSHGAGNNDPIYSEEYPDDTAGQQNPTEVAEWYYHTEPQQGNGENANEDNYSRGLGDSLSMYDQVNPAASYDFFQSPLLSNNTTSLPHKTIQAEMNNKSPVRSKSLQMQMQALPYSPHDTEPFSSNVSRSKSDNTGQQRQASLNVNTPDESSATPVAIEIPVVSQKKQGQKKKQSLPETDEEDGEIFVPSDRGILDEHGKPMEKKKKNPCHSRSSVRFVEEDEPNKSHDVETAEILPPIFTTDDIHQNTQPENDIDNDEIQLVEVHDPDIPPTEPQQEEAKQVHTTEPEPAKPQPKPKSAKSTAAKEPKKKKLKRGKTTSVTLKKTYEPDVEDDVIWIDDRSSNNNHNHNPAGEEAIQHEPMSIPTPDSLSMVADEQPNSMPIPMVEIPQANPSLAEMGAKEPVQDHGWDQAEVAQSEEPAQQPKKRGRKRKKTAEQPQQQPEQEASTNSTGTAQPATTTTPAEWNNNNNNHHAAPPAETTTEQQPEPEPEPTTPKKQPSTSAAHDTAAANINADKGKDADQSGIINSSANKGPSKHSPIAGTSKVPYRVGLSRRARIAPLLSVVRR